MNAEQNGFGIDFLHITTVTCREMQEDSENILEQVSAGDSPILIVDDHERLLLLFEWNDYWKRFGALHPEGEKERAEAECRRIEEGLK